VSSLALVPVKAGGTGKQRLARSLTGEQRAGLIRVMLREVLAALAATPAIDTVVVLSGARGDVPEALEVVPDSGTGLTARGATRLTVLFADLPLVDAADITALVGTADAHTVAVAPDHAGTGTNALTLALPTAFRLQFGPGSFAAHLAEAARLGLGVATVRRTGLACDIDEPADVAALIGRRDPRYAFLG
jgi:2-phospho-L-lactate guanylyltransferase